MALKTPLYSKHKEQNAKFVEFGGFEMPVWYKGTMDEYKAVRERVGLFDINHMGRLVVTGHDRDLLINYLITNDLKKIDYQGILYSFICDDNGYILDDLLVYLYADKALLVVNAGQSEHLIQHIKEHSQNYQYEIEDLSNNTGFLALQGPKSFQLCKKIFGEDIENIDYYTFTKIEFQQQEIIISRTGYTGEKGVELFFDGELNETLWDTLITEGEEFGIEPCGLASRDILRLEMGYPLYGNELKGYTPIELHKKWCTSLKKTDFVGKKILEEQNQKGVPSKPIGFVMESKAIPRHDYEIWKNDTKIGKVTSGGFSPKLNKGIGLAIVNIEEANINNEIEIVIRNKKNPARTCKIPFIPSNVK